MSLTLNQLICTTLLLLPYAVSHIPAPEAFTPGTVGGILYLGVVSEAGKLSDTGKSDQGDRCNTRHPCIRILYL